MWRREKLRSGSVGSTVSDTYVSFEHQSRAEEELPERLQQWRLGEVRGR